MKKLATAVLSGALALTVVLSACSTPGASAGDPEASAEEEPKGTPTIVGGWTIQTEATNTLTEEQKALFKQAIDALMGIDYEPVAQIATQELADKSHAFLCKGKMDGAQPQENWYIVSVFEAPNGEAVVSNIAQINVTGLQTVKGEMNPELLDSWKVAEPSNAKLLPEQAATAFAKAAEGEKELSLSPIATLATQLVSGTNYLVLCSGTTADAGADRSLYAVTVYADLNGGAKFSSVEQLNLPAYVSGV